MKWNVMMALGLLLFSVGATAAPAADQKVVSAECAVSVDLDTSGDFETQLGKFTVERVTKSQTPELVGSEYGQFQSVAYDGGHQKYAARTTMIEVSIERESGQPYEVKFLGLTAERKAEGETELRANELPSDLRLKIGPLQGGTAQQILRSTRLSCAKK